ncbi:MAG: hypothetical protein U1E46_17395 [Hyphomicrobiales bacterium]
MNSFNWSKALARLAVVVVTFITAAMCLMIALTVVVDRSPMRAYDTRFRAIELAAVVGCLAAAAVGLGWAAAGLRTPRRRQHLR